MAQGQDDDDDERVSMGLTAAAAVRDRSTNQKTDAN
jgi:hypothetical protein